MKKFFLVVCLILSLQLISSIEFNINTEFSQGETFLVKISGNFLSPPTLSNIFFYKDHTRVSIAPQLSKIQDEYYISASLPESPGNYSLVLEEVRYYKGTKVSEEDLVKEFIITNNTADFSVDKGAVTSSNKFTLTFQNLQENKITVNVNSKTISGGTVGFFDSLFGSSVSTNTSSDYSFDLSSGEIKKITFSVSQVNESTLSEITLSSTNTNYVIPVYIIPNLTAQEKEYKMNFEPDSLYLNLSTNSTQTKFIYLNNTGTETLENITISVSKSIKDYVNISRESLDELDPASVLKLEVSFKSDFDPKKIEGQITAIANGEIYSYSAIFLTFIQNYIPTETEKDPYSEIPKNNSELIDDNPAQTSTSSTGQIIGWVIILALIGFAYWFYKNKYKKAK
jgi:hypothetical protein